MTLSSTHLLTLEPPHCHTCIRLTNSIVTRSPHCVSSLAPQTSGQFVLRLLAVGHREVGKSTFLRCFAGEDPIGHIPQGGYVGSLTTYVWLRGLRSCLRMHLPMGCTNVTMHPMSPLRDSQEPPLPPRQPIAFVYARDMTAVTEYEPSIGLERQSKRLRVK